MISIIHIENKQLTFNGKNVSLILYKNNLRFKRKDVGDISVYANPDDGSQKQITLKYKKQLSEIFEMKILSQPNYHVGVIVFISEPGLYEMIFSSKLPIASDFKKWVFEKVVPCIRKYGEYNTKDKIIK